jgi:phage gp36-like protein
MVIPQDFKTHLYAEIIDAIDRADEEILQDAIASAEAEAMGYLSRYDTDLLFAREDEARDPLLMQRVKDIAVWHFINLANPDTNMQLRKTRYDEAIAWLKDIQKGQVIMKNWPVPIIEDYVQGSWNVSSRPRRETNW